MSNMDHAESNSDLIHTDVTGVHGVISAPSELPETVHLFPTLASIREEKGFTAELVASSLRLSNSQIIALEQMRWVDLPGPAYVKGFLRGYCKFLGVPAEPYIEDYAKQLGIYTPPTVVEVSKVVPNMKQDLSLPQTLASFDNGDEVKAQKKLMLIIALVLVGFTIVFLLYWERAMWWSSLKERVSALHIGQKFDTTASSHAGKEVFELGAGTKNTNLQEHHNDEAVINGSKLKAQVVLSQAVVLNAPVVASTPTLNAGAKVIDLYFTEPVWAEVRDKTGAVITTGMHASNSTTSVKGNPPLLVIIGAAHAAKLNVDGKQMDLAPHTVANVAKVKVQ